MRLKYEINPFNGAVINNDFLNIEENTFNNELKITIKELREKNISLVWLFLPTNSSKFVPIAIEQGFIYHHADELGAELILKLKKNAFVPAYATHYIGAGGVVIDDENRILVVHERYHKIKHFKLPGGALDPKEHISAAVVREVFEETGIKTEFISVNCFRHWHDYKFGKSDIYFICKLKPLSRNIKIDNKEISKAIWLPINEYLSDPNTHIFNKRVVEQTLNSTGMKIEKIPGYKDDITHELLF